MLGWAVKQMASKYADENAQLFPSLSLFLLRLPPARFPDREHNEFPAPNLSPSFLLPFPSPKKVAPKAIITAVASSGFLGGTCQNMEQHPERDRNRSQTFLSFLPFLRRSIMWPPDLGHGVQRREERPLWQKVVKTLEVPERFFSSTVCRPSELGFQKNKVTERRPWTLNYDWLLCSIMIS